MDDTQRFWLQQDRWPRDTAEHVFLARAVHLVGSAMFSEWTGAEPFTPERCSLTQVDPSTGAIRGISQSDASAWQIKRVRKLLELDVPDRGRPSLSASQWFQGLRLVAELDGKGDPARKRFKLVKDSISASIESGQLKSAVWMKSSAKMEPIPSDLWKVEDVGRRFVWCLMNPKEPFGIGIGGANFHSIYITRTTLDGYLSDIRQHRTSSGHTPSNARQSERNSARSDPSQDQRNVPPVPRTGMAGRPEKSAWILQEELRRRATTGELENSLAAQVHVLLNWLKMKHPDSPPPKQGTTENNLRSLFKELRNPRNQPMK